MNALGLSVIDPSYSPGYQEWLDAHKASRQLEPHSHPAYCLATAADGSLVRCAIWQDSGGQILMPFELRSIEEVVEGAEYRDAATPYGYGGAYYRGNVDATGFWKSWHEWCIQENVVGLLVRGSLFAEETLVVGSHATVASPNVVIDLTQGEDQMLAAMSSTTRSRIRRAQRLGVTVSQSATEASIARFHALYTATMSRLGASGYYFFSLDKLTAIARGLDRSLTIFEADFEGEVVASEMYLHGVDHAYFFLGASDAAHRSVPAGNLIKWEACRYFAGRLSKSALVLGGGVGSDDSLFRYKMGFAPGGVRQFKVEWRCEQPKIQEWLMRERWRKESSWQPRENFLPPYRA